MYIEEYEIYFKRITRVGFHEKYAVYYKQPISCFMNGIKIGSLSFNFGALIFTYRDKNNNENIEIFTNFGYLGMNEFICEEQRVYYLDLVAKKIYEKIKNKEIFKIVTIIRGK